MPCHPQRRRGYCPQLLDLLPSPLPVKRDCDCGLTTPSLSVLWHRTATSAHQLWSRCLDPFCCPLAGRRRRLLSATCLLPRAPQPASQNLPTAAVDSALRLHLFPVPPKKSPCHWENSLAGSLTLASPGSVPGEPRTQQLLGCTPLHSVAGCPFQLSSPLPRSPYPSVGGKWDSTEDSPSLCTGPAGLVRDCGGQHPSRRPLSFPAQHWELILCPRS